MASDAHKISETTKVGNVDTASSHLSSNGSHTSLYACAPTLVLRLNGCIVSNGSKTGATGGATGGARMSSISLVSVVMEAAKAALSMFAHGRDQARTLRSLLRLIILLLR